MARRRRKKNPILTRILVISVVVHVIAIPVAAKFGVFEKVQKEFGQSRVVMVTVPPEAEEKKAVDKKAKKTPKVQKAAQKASSSAPKSTTAAKSNLPQPKVVASAAGGEDGEGGATVDPNGAGKAGEVPHEATPPKPTEPPPPPVNETKPPVNPVTPTEPTRPTEVVKTEPKPELKVEPPKPKPFVQAETTFAPEPEIPDDLRAEPFEKTVLVEADIDVNGEPSGVRVAESSGVRELDSVGLATAKRYRFKPATLGGDPVVGHVRFRIIFKVE